MWSKCNLKYLYRFLKFLSVYSGQARKNWVLFLLIGALVAPMVKISSGVNVVIAAALVLSMNTVILQDREFQIHHQEL